MMKPIAVKKTGNLFVEDHKNQLSLVLANQCIFTELDGNLTAFDRKFYLLLLHLSFDDLDSKSKLGRFHEISESDLRQLIKTHIYEKRTCKIYDSVKRLVKTSVEYRFIENDKRFIGLTSLMSAQMTEDDESDGIFKWKYDAQLAEILKSPIVFSRLFLKFLFSLKSKYSIKMYEICSSLVNLRNKSITFSIDEIRTFLQANDKLNQSSFLYKRAILPAITEINSKSDICGFSILHELIRKGRGSKIDAIKISVVVNNDQNRLHNVNSLNHNQSSQRTFSNTEIYEKAKRIAANSGLDVYGLESEWLDSIKKSNIVVLNKEAHYLGFIKHKVKSKK